MMSPLASAICDFRKGPLMSAIARAGLDLAGAPNLTKGQFPSSESSHAFANLMKLAANDSGAVPVEPQRQPPSYEDASPRAKRELSEQQYNSLSDRAKLQFNPQVTSYDNLPDHIKNNLSRERYEGMTDHGKLETYCAPVPYDELSPAVQRTLTPEMYGMLEPSSQKIHSRHCSPNPY